MEDRLWLRLHKKGGNELEIPYHHNLESYLSAYIAEAGIQGDHEGPLFRSLDRDGSFSERRFNQHSAWEMLAQRARAAGITAYHENPEARVEVAQYLAGHAKTETSKLYDRREERVLLDEVERIGI